jgi:hypothetical protein
MRYLLNESQLNYVVDCYIMRGVDNRYVAGLALMSLQRSTESAP